MATKTISVDLEAYDRLQQARLSARESFSQVIKRAHWSEPGHTAAGLLAAMEGVPVVDEATLETWDKAQATDAPPPTRWPND